MYLKCVILRVSVSPNVKYLSFKNEKSTASCAITWSLLKKSITIIYYSETFLEHYNGISLEFIELTDISYDLYNSVFE